jgi:hypothetical protein
LLLAGKGDGTFQALSGQESGIILYGDQRSASVADFDHDGRPDLAVSQNNGPTALFHNQSGSPGLRVKLASPINAQLRWTTGPAREIHFGHGYWSQDAAVQILPRRSGDTRLSIRFPGGKSTIVEIPPSARKVEIDASGGLKINLP